MVEALQAAGIGASLVRLSIGLESVEDLVVDVLDALQAARDAVTRQSVKAVEAIA